MLPGKQGNTQTDSWLLARKSLTAEMFVLKNMAAEISNDIQHDLSATRGSGGM